MKEAKERDGGCGACKSMEEEIYWRHINPICFFVSFRSDFHQMLKIPKRFADNVVPNILLEKLRVKGPSGASWEVDVIKSVDGHFLQGGWEEFVNAYSIQENDTLLFTYDRRSSFDVKIFDGECEKVDAYFVKKCEHVSPSVKSCKKRGLAEIMESDDDDDDNGDDGSDVEVCAGPSSVNRKHQGARLKPCIKTTDKIWSQRKRVQFAVNYVRKKCMSRSSMDKQGGGSQAETESAIPPQKNGPPDKEVPAENGSTSKEVPSADQNPPEAPAQNGSTSKEVPSADQNPPEAPEKAPPPGFENVVLPRTRPRSTMGSRSMKKKPLPDEYASNRRPVTDQEKDDALRKAALELTDNSFFAALPFTACYKGFFVTIPARFASTHLGLRNQEVILRMGAKKWKTKFSFSRGGLGPGWKKFALENNLEESDACLFKLVSQESGETVMLDVTIFRVVEDVVVPPTLLMSPRL